MEWITSFVGSIESRNIPKIHEGISSLIESHTIRFLAKGCYDRIIEKLLICESEEFDIFEHLDLLLVTLAKEGHDIITPLVNHLEGNKDNNNRILIAIHLKQALQHVIFN